MSTDDKLVITCACKAVQIEAEGEPVYKCYCHCESCRKCSGAPFLAVCGFKEDKVVVTKGEDQIFDYIPEGSAIPRKKCKICMACVGDAVPKQGLKGLCVALCEGPIPQRYIPQYHVMYKERNLDFPDGKEKWVGTRAGGRGELCDKSLW